MFHSTTEYISHLKANFSDAIAFRWIEDTTGCICEKTYADFIVDIQKFAAYLNEINPDVSGKHIALMAMNSYHYAVAAFAVIQKQAVLVPINYHERAELLQEQLCFADVDYILTDAAIMDTCNWLADACALPVFSVADYTQHLPSALTDDTHIDRLAILMFTSGTTGQSKCVQLTVKNLFAANEMIHEIIRDVRETHTIEIDRYLSILPMFHIYGICLLLLLPYRGITQNLCLDYRNLVRDTIQMGSNFTAAVPMVVENWTKALKRGKRDVLGGITGIICGGAAMNPAIIDIFGNNGVTMIQAYGMSETAITGMYNPMKDPRKIASIGIAEKDVSVLFDDGELCIKSEAVTSGYYNNPEETSNAIRDGWLHTGDLGYMDEDGYVYLTGRKKNLIILSSGENVSPEELENLVSKNAAVKEVVVTEKNCKICAEIWCDPDMQEEIRSFITEANRPLAMYKRITLVEFRTEPFPRTASGKIKRG